MKTNISTTIIAGGKGSRLGRPKYDVYFQKKRLLDIALDLAKGLSEDISVVCGTMTCKLPEKVMMLKDITPNCGPIGGIFTALHHTKTQWLAVMPVDMPYLSKEVYDLLLQNIDKERPVVAVSKKGLEPLVSIWPKSSEDMIRKFIEKKKYSIRHCLKALQYEGIYIADLLVDPVNDYFFNINTKEDLL